MIKRHFNRCFSYHCFNSRPSAITATTNQVCLCDKMIFVGRTALAGSTEYPGIPFQHRGNGLITSAIKLAIRLTIKLETYCSYNKQHFIVATTKMLMRAATVVRRRQLRSAPSPPKILRLSIVMGAGSGG